MGYQCPEYYITKKKKKKIALGEAAQKVLCKDSVNSVQNCFLCFV